VHFLLRLWQLRGLHHRPAIEGSTAGAAGGRRGMRKMSSPRRWTGVCADVQTAKDEFVSRAATRVLEKVEW
jgi:hypothetical protein